MLKQHACELLYENVRPPANQRAENSSEPSKADSEDVHSTQEWREPEDNENRTAYLSQELDLPPIEELTGLSLSGISSSTYDDENDLNSLIAEALPTEKDLSMSGPQYYLPEAEYALQMEKIDKKNIDPLKYVKSTSQSESIAGSKKELRTKEIQTEPAMSTSKQTNSEELVKSLIDEAAAAQIKELEGQVANMRSEQANLMENREEDRIQCLRLTQVSYELSRELHERRKAATNDAKRIIELSKRLDELRAEMYHRYKEKKDGSSSK
jgi:hypothetical protein